MCSQDRIGDINIRAKNGTGSLIDIGDRNRMRPAIRMDGSGRSNEVVEPFVPYLHNDGGVSRIELLGELPVEIKWAFAPVLHFASRGPSFSVRVGADSVESLFVPDFTPYGEIQMGAPFFEKFRIGNSEIV